MNVEIMFHTDLSSRVKCKSEQVDRPRMSTRKPQEDSGIEHEKRVGYRMIPPPENVVCVMAVLSHCNPTNFTSM